MALYSMQYTRRDNEALFIQAAKVSLRESLIHNKKDGTIRKYGK
jgi:hypothetical protein